MSGKPPAYDPQPQDPMYPPPEYATSAADQQLTAPDQASPKGPDYTPTPENKYRDPVFAVAFLALVIATFIITAVYGPPFMSAGGLEHLSTESRDTPTDDGSVVPPMDGSQDTDTATASASDTDLALVIIAGGIGAALFSMLWLSIMKSCAATIIKINLVITLVALILMGLTVSVIFFLFALLTAGYFYMVRHRIPFASAMLFGAVQSISKTSGLLLVALSMAVLQGAFSLLCLFAYIATTSQTQVEEIFDSEGKLMLGPTTGTGSAISLLLLISFFWTTQVCKNIAHTTTAGTAATWWMVSDSPNKTCPAFKRATTTSFGSVCMGSLMVAILRLIRSLIQSNNQCKSVACIMNCIEQMVEYFNLYAYTHVAIYGKPFIQSAKDTWQMFKAKGFDVIINDDLTGAVLTMGSVLCACVAGIVGVAVGFALGVEGSSLGLAAFIAFVLGFFLGGLTMGIVESGVATTMVIWCEDPGTMQQVRPTEYQKLQDVSNFYPGVRLGNDQGNHGRAMNAI